MPEGKLAIIVDFAVGWDKTARGVILLAAHLGADIWAAPYHVQGVVDYLDQNYTRNPNTTGAVRKVLGA